VREIVYPRTWVRPGMKVLEIIEDGDEKNAMSDTHACVFRGPEDEIILAFRGSVSIENFKTDAKSLRWSKLTELDTLCNSGDLAEKLDISSAAAQWDPVYCGKGFVDAYSTIRSGVHGAVRRALKDVGSKKLIVTGHSLGAAMSLIGALDLRVHLPLDVAMHTYSFACPPAGNSAFVRMLEAQPNFSCLRINNLNDVVANLGFVCGVLPIYGYKHTHDYVQLQHYDYLENANPLEMLLLSSPAVSAADHGMDNYSRAVEAACLAMNQTRSEEECIKPYLKAKNANVQSVSLPVFYRQGDDFIYSPAPESDTHAEKPHEILEFEAKESTTVDPCVLGEYGDSVPSLFDQMQEPGAVLDEVLGGAERRALVRAQQDCCCCNCCKSSA